MTVKAAPKRVEGVHIERWPGIENEWVWDLPGDTTVIAWCGAVGVVHEAGGISPPEFDFYHPHGGGGPKTCQACVKARSR